MQPKPLRRTSVGVRNYLKDLPAPKVIYPLRVCIIMQTLLKFLMALDENLKRKDMTWQEIAFYELEEKRIYEECYPETGHGANIEKGTKGAIQRGAESATRYTAAKATATGKSERVIQENIQLAKAIEEEPEKFEKAKTKQQALKIIKKKESHIAQAIAANQEIVESTR